MSINPSAVLLWVLAAAIGYLVAGTDGAVWGFVIMCGISTLIAFIDVIFFRKL
jgi:tetrahydromethanopterin S-methyltransferase subunit B